MKIRSLTLAVVAVVSFLAGTLVPVAWTQSETTPRYMLVADMKVRPGDGQAYVAMERDVWKPMHKKIIESGKTRSWSLYGVMFSGTEDPYNYVTVQTFDSLDDFYSVDFAKVAGEVHPDRAVASLSEQALKMRDNVADQLLWRIEHAE